MEPEKKKPLLDIKIGKAKALRLGWSTVGTAVLAVAAVYVTFTYFIEFSAFAMLIGKLSMGLAAAFLVDNFVFGDFKTVDEIRNGNVAYAIVYFGLMVIVAACVASV